VIVGAEDTCDPDPGPDRLSLRLFIFGEVSRVSSLEGVVLNLLPGLRFRSVIFTKQKIPKTYTNKGSYLDHIRVDLLDVWAVLHNLELVVRVLGDRVHF
jgi:hypothetical protein